MAPSLLGLGVVLYLLTIEVLRWLRGSDTVWDVLVWAVVLIPLILACLIAGHGRWDMQGDDHCDRQGKADFS